MVQFLENRAADKLYDIWILFSLSDIFDVASLQLSIAIVKNVEHDYYRNFGGFLRGNFI